MRLLDETVPGFWHEQAAEQPHRARRSIQPFSVNVSRDVGSLSHQTYPCWGEFLIVDASVVLAFAPLTNPAAMPGFPRAGTWFAFAYHLGHMRSGMDICDAIEISRFQPGSSVPAHLSGPGSITCLVHEAWLEEFAKSFGLDLPLTADVLRDGIYYLPMELRAIATCALVYDLTGPARQTYRRAKGLELLCETARMSLMGNLVTSQARNGLSAADIQRLVSARNTIAEQFDKKLTIDGISRVCGLNRAKLTRGFKVLFGSSVGEALSETRLAQACSLLKMSSKSIGSIGYEVGYLNNTSFTRAFTRYFKVSPSTYRAKARRALCRAGAGSDWREEVAA